MRFLAFGGYECVLAFPVWYLAGFVPQPDLQYIMTICQLEWYHLMFNSMVMKNLIYLAICKI